MPKVDNEGWDLQEHEGKPGVVVVVSRLLADGARRCPVPHPMSCGPSSHRAARSSISVRA
ncbi:hypothetical protein BN2476_190008 [Paraburkholderia piptadeniae]|uniref:Uncharacterized protein n=1 Tax=Paraburkholderia piptadeniae TaxID=1701573 RepID=A0A1N7RUK0_9BURK|nr:hypothetical protein BN2476_190008 [Paraburkholderia piptadeniae]